MEDLVNEPLIGELNQIYIDRVVQLHSSDNFGVVQRTVCKNVGGRSLSRLEKSFIDTALHQKRIKRADLNRISDSIWNSSALPIELQSNNILMVTAYSNDYSIGGLCEKVNKNYALKYGYQFLSDILTLSDMTKIISPKKHCTWYKIALMRKLLNDTDHLTKNRIDYIMWIDADAIVVDQTVLLTDIIARAHGKDLIIAEDMNTGCLINAGVFLLRTTHWSKRFIEEVWNCARYDDVTFYEQSAMIRSLRAEKEGLDTITPFHSYLPGAVQGIKYFPHVAVLPIQELNTNRGLLCNDVLAFESFERSVVNAPISMGSMGCEEGGSFKANDAGSTPELLVVPLVPAPSVPSCVDTVLGSAAYIKSICYREDGNYCSLCRRTVRLQHYQRGSKHVQDRDSSCDAKLFIFHPAGMPDKLKMLHTAIYKHHINCDLESEIRIAASALGSSVANAASVGGTGAGEGSAVVVATGPLRLVRGKMGQIPQANQPHLFSRLEQRHEKS